MILVGVVWLDLILVSAKRLVTSGSTGFEQVDAVGEHGVRMNDDVVDDALVAFVGESGVRMDDNNGNASVAFAVEPGVRKVDDDDDNASTAFIA